MYKPQHWRKKWDVKEQSCWWKRIEFLLEALTFDKPVYVHRVPMKRDNGDCRDLGDRYLVRISNTLSYGFAVHILLHELAHAMEPFEEHGPAFHMAQFEIWLAYNEYELDDA